MATLSRHHIHIDEVQHVVASRDCSRKTTSVVPRNVYRRCLVRPLFSRRRQAFSDRGSGPQGLRRPRFSFFRFTCQTARDQEDPLSETPESRRSPKPPTETGCLVTLSVRSFAGAPSRRKAGGAPLWGYIGSGRGPCQQPSSAKFSANSYCGWPRPQPSCRVFRGPLAPHWRHIPTALFGPGKGQWSRHESNNARATNVDAPEGALHRSDACR